MEWRSHEDDTLPSRAIGDFLDAKGFVARARFAVHGPAAALGQDDSDDADPAQYTQSLGCWHGFIGQQKMISIKKHFGTTKGRYLYLSGWMIAALRSAKPEWLFNLTESIPWIPFILPL